MNEETTNEEITDAQIYANAVSAMREAHDNPDIGKPDWIIRAQNRAGEFLNAGYRRQARQGHCAECVELGIQ